MKNKTILSAKEIALFICNIVSSKERIDIHNIESSNCGTSEYSKGIYFLYNEQDEVIYVGMTYADNQSLHKRINGNGNGAHNRKTWFKEVCYVKFHRFGYSKEQLALAERIAINEMGPRYNDETLTREHLSKFKWQ